MTLMQFLLTLLVLDILALMILLVRKKQLERRLEDVRWRAKIKQEVDEVCSKAERARQDALEYGRLRFSEDPTTHQIKAFIDKYH